MADISQTDPIHRIKAVLFDLDGTLADTALDLADALNATLQHFGQEPLPFELIRTQVSNGGAALIRLGFDIEAHQDGFEERRLYLLDYYKRHLCKKTRLMDGIQTVLDHLSEENIPWGIVTNKPSWLTDPLMDAMQLTDQAGCIVSGDTCRHSKPHPEPLLHACRQLNVPPGQCLYVGDAARDIEAGRAAGCATVAALFGYLLEADRPEDWQADYSITKATDLIDLLGQNQQYQTAKS